MQLKRITAIAVLLLVVASLAVAGCTTEVPVEVKVGPANQASDISTAYPTAGKRSELLQGIEAERNRSAANYDDYKATWLNDTTLIIHEKSASTGSVHTWEYKFIHFPTIEDATAYYDSHRLGYTYKPSSLDHASLYYIVTGVKNATVMKQVSKFGDTSYDLEQIDALIIESSRHTDNINQA